MMKRGSIGDVNIPLNWINPRRSPTHGPSTDDPMIWYEGATVSSSSRRSLQVDQEGSIVSVADALGNAITLNTYDEYGVPAANNVGRFQYTGQAWIPELGLDYYKARFYNPSLGRFMQTDPIGYKDDLDLYAYVGNDPLDGTDPSGECFLGIFGSGCSTPPPATTVASTAAATTTTMEEVVVTGTRTATATVAAERVPVVAAGGIFACMLFDCTGGTMICGDSGCHPVMAQSTKNDNVMTAEQKKPSDKTRQSKPTNAPPGTKPIDQSGKSHDWIEGTKGDVDAGPTDWTGVAPNGDIITTGRDGKAENHGPSDRKN